MLAGSSFSFRKLDWHTGLDHLIAEQAVDWLCLRSLEELIVLVVPTPRPQPIPALFCRFFVGIAQKIELELRGHHGTKAQAFGPLDLAAKDRAWRDRDELAGGLIDEIAKHHCRLF